MKKLKHGFYLFLMSFINLLICPSWRATILRICGAKIGVNVRIHSINLFNLENGFRNLVIGDDAYIGPACRIDLAGRVKINRGAVLSSGTCIMTHNDPGSYHNSPLCRIYPPNKMPVEISEYAWIGVNSVILAGSKIGKCTVVGSMSLVCGCLEDWSVYVGIPVRKIKTIQVKLPQLEMAKN